MLSEIRMCKKCNVNPVWAWSEALEMYVCELCGGEALLSGEERAHMANIAPVWEERFEKEGVRVGLYSLEGMLYYVHRMAGTPGWTNDETQRYMRGAITATRSLRQLLEGFDEELIEKAKDGLRRLAG